MVKMMVTVVIVFTVCWLPFNILNVSNNNSYFSILTKCYKKINLILIVIIIIQINV